MTPAVRIRPATDGDMAYIYETWLEGQRGEFPDMRDSDYYPWQRARIGQLLATGAVLNVASPEEAQSVIWAWLCWSRMAVHYLYVRPAHRKTGLATQMLAGFDLAKPLRITALSPDARAIKRAHPDLLRYVPL